MAFVLHGPELLSHVHSHSHGHGHSHSAGGLPAREMRPVFTSSMENGWVPKKYLYNYNLYTIFWRSIRYRAREHSSHQEEQNINIRAAIIHVFGDFIQSVGVFLASIVIYCFVSIRDKLCRWVQCESAPSIWVGGFVFWNMTSCWILGFRRETAASAST